MMQPFCLIKQSTAYELRIGDWSSGVYSSVLGKNAEHHPARWRRGVDLRALAGEHPQTDTAIRQILHRADQVGGRSAEPVELPNDEDIAVAQRFQAGGKTWAIITATGCTITIDIDRSAERRVGTECVSTFRSLGAT